MSEWFNASSAKFILGFLGIITASFILAIVISNIKEGEALSQPDAGLQVSPE
jgi:hypothetical protein